MQNAYPSSGILYTIQLQSLEALLCQIDQIDEHCRYRLSCLTESGGGSATGGDSSDALSLSLEPSRERPSLEATRMSSTESTSSTHSLSSISAFPSSAAADAGASAPGAATVDGGGKAIEDEESEQQQQRQEHEKNSSAGDRERTADDSELTNVRPLRASRIRPNRMPLQTPLPIPELLSAQKRRKNVCTLA